MSRKFHSRGFHSKGFYNRGFYLSMEAIISLIILVSVLALPFVSDRNNLDSLYIFQQENDLLKIWAMDGEFNTGEMISDFEFLFSGKSGVLEIGDSRIEIGADFTGDAVSSTAYFYGYGLREIKITITVFD